MLSWAPQPRVNSLTDICPRISLWVQRETDFIFFEKKWDTGAYISKILFWGAAGKHSCPQPVWQPLHHAWVSCVKSTAARSTVVLCLGVCAQGTRWEISAWNLMENWLFVAVGPWYTEQHSDLGSTAEEGPTYRYSSLQKLQEILYSWAFQTRSSTAKVTLWCVPVIGSLWSCGCKEQGQLF